MRWKKLQSQRWNFGIVETEYGPAYKNINCGIALLMGAINGNLEAIDLDFKHDQSRCQRYVEVIKTQYPEIFGKLVIQRTRSGGQHWIYKCQNIGRNNPTLAYGDKEGVACIETRGEGGYILVAPSNGYSTLQGDLLNVHTITSNERQILFLEAQKLCSGKKSKKSSTSTIKVPRVFNQDQNGDAVPVQLRKDWAKLEYLRTPSGKISKQAAKGKNRDTIRGAIKRLVGIGWLIPCGDGWIMPSREKLANRIGIPFVKHKKRFKRIEAKKTDKASTTIKNYSVSIQRYVADRFKRQIIHAQTKDVRNLQETEAVKKAMCEKIKDNGVQFSIDSAARLFGYKSFNSGRKYRKEYFKLLHARTPLLYDNGWKYECNSILLR